jgi:hypothetical protein
MQQHEADRTIHVVNIVVHIRHLRQESVRHFLKKKNLFAIPSLRLYIQKTTTSH